MILKMLTFICLKARERKWDSMTAYEQEEERENEGARRRWDLSPAEFAEAGLGQASNVVAQRNWIKSGGARTRIPILTRVVYFPGSLLCHKTTPTFNLIEGLKFCFIS